MGYRELLSGEGSYSPRKNTKTKTYSNNGETDFNKPKVDYVSLILGDNNNFYERQKENQVKWQKQEEEEKAQIENFKKISSQNQATTNSLNPLEVKSDTEAETKKETKKKKKSSLFKSQEEREQELLRKAMGDEGYQKFNEGKEDLLNSLDEKEKEAKESGKHNFYFNYVQPLLYGVAEPLTDIKSMSYNSKESREKYGDDLKEYKKNLNTGGKFLNTVGNIGSNIALSSLAGLDKIKYAKNPLLNAAIREGVENAAFEGVTDFSKGDTENFVTDRIKDFGAGAIFGGTLEGVGRGIKKGVKAIDNKMSNELTGLFDDTIDHLNTTALDNTTSDFSAKVKYVPKTNKAHNTIKKANIKYDLPNVSGLDLNRSFENFTDIGGNKKISLLSEQMGELKPYINDRAGELLDDLKNSTINETSVVAKNYDDYVIGDKLQERFTTPTITSETIEVIKAQTGKSYAEIEKGLQDLINGKNNALTRKLEVIIDDMLTNGYTSGVTQRVPIDANNEYLEIKEAYKHLQDGTFDTYVKNNSQADISLLNQSKQSIPVKAENFTEGQETLNKAILNPNEVAMSKLEETKLSKHANDTALNSPYVTKKMKQAISEKDYEYFVHHDTDVLAKASENALKENAVNDFIAYKGKMTDEYIATGEVLFKKLQNEGKFDEALNVIEKLTTEGSNLGQSLRMYRLMNSLTPEGKLIYTQRMIDKYNSSLSDIDKAIKMNDEQAKQILDHMKKAETLEGRAKSKEIAKANKIIEKIIPSSFMDKINGFRYINMLFNPKTLLKNVFGNVVNNTANVGRDFVGSGIDKLVSSKTGQRTLYMPNIESTIAYFKGGANGLKNVVDDFVEGIDTTRVGKEGVKNNPFRNSKNFVGKGLEKVSDLLSFGLKVGDEPFKNASYQAYITNYMKHNNITDMADVPQKILDEAEKVGREAVYQQRTDLGDLINKGKNSKNKVINAATNIALPFSQTPSAILDTAINYTPVGAIRGVNNINKAIKGTKANAGTNLVNNAFSNQRQGVNQLASSIVGTGLTGLGIVGAKNGLLTGDISQDKDVRNLEQQVGMQPYAFKLGDTYNSLDFMQPLSSPLMVGADLSNAKKDNVSIGDIAKDSIETAINSIAGNSYLDGISGLFSKEFGEMPEYLMGEGLKQMIPFSSLGGAITRQVNPNKKDISSNNTLDAVLNTALSKYPFTVDQLPNKTDTLGNDVLYNEGFGKVGSFINNFVNPLNTTKYQPNEIEKNVLDMYNETGDTVQFPRVAPNSISLGNGESYILTADDKKEYSKLINKYLSNAKETPEEYQKAMTKATKVFKERIKNK